MKDDKLTELERYDNRARALLASDTISAVKSGALGVSRVYRAPYHHYEACLRHVVREGDVVLELGAGTGLHTSSLRATGARVVATDISSNSLRVLYRRLERRVNCTVTDMESLAFQESSFDVVACAGSLSYGAPAAVDSEILRVLKPSGSLVCVDSLDHNPVYRLNRWIGYLRGRRTAATIRNMPMIGRLEALSEAFEQSTIQYFGSIAYLAPFLSKLVGPGPAANMSDSVDRLVGTRRSAFKFVLVATGRR